jgi:IPT/TIG domain
MPILDDRGRLFGRLNLADAALGLFVLVLIPAAYGSYLLFKDPVPTLSEVLPRTLTQGPNLQVEIHGEHLRPYMRVSFGEAQGREILFVNATTVVVPLPPDLPSGRYDIVLYDYMREVARMKSALTIEPSPAPPTVTIELAGMLTSLTDEQARQIEKGHRLPESGDNAAEVLWVGTPAQQVLHIKVGDRSAVDVPVEKQLQLPVRIRTRCMVETAADGTLRCAVGGVRLAPGANVTLRGMNTFLNFRVADDDPVPMTK